MTTHAVSEGTIRSPKRARVACLFKNAFAPSHHQIISPQTPIPSLFDSCPATEHVSNGFCIVDDSPRFTIYTPRTKGTMSDSFTSVSHHVLRPLSGDGVFVSPSEHSQKSTDVARDGWTMNTIIVPSNCLRCLQDHRSILTSLGQQLAP